MRVEGDRGTAAEKRSAVSMLELATSKHSCWPRSLRWKLNEDPGNENHGLAVVFTPIKSDAHETHYMYM